MPVELKDEQKATLQAYLLAEAVLMKQIHSLTTEVNTMIKAIASKDGNSDLKNYVSRDDYKIIMKLDDDIIDKWVWYCKNIIGDDYLVDNMPKKSFLKGVARKSGSNNSQSAPKKDDQSNPSKQP